jgi:hypothetical protein
MTNLYKDAIAEAKVVKALAEKNAFNLLAEALSTNSSVNGIISKKLAEEADEEEDVVQPEMSTTEEVPPVAEPSMEEDDTELDEILKELEGEMDDEEPIEEDDDFDLSGATTPAVEDEDEEAIDTEIDEILREMDDEAELDMPEPEPDEEMEAENRSLKLELKKARNVINKQKAALHEVGLMNAKLLLVTKLLGKLNLSESAKLSIISSIDKAKTLREAKLIYSTIAENLNKSGKTIKEGVSSKSTRSVGKPTNRMFLTEQTNVIDTARWKKLAGII